MTVRNLVMKLGPTEYPTQWVAVETHCGTSSQNVKTLGTRRSYKLLERKTNKKIDYKQRPGITMLLNFSTSILDARMIKEHDFYCRI